MLGAGASRTSGIKSGQELVRIWDKELSERNQEEHRKWKEKLGINEKNQDSFYSQYYERRFWRRPADGYNYLEKLMEHAKPSVGYVMLSYLLTNTDHNVVITTNFDHLTEDAVNYYVQEIPLIIGHESLAHYVSKQLKRPTIIKIHRDLLFDPKNRTEELELLHENWKKALGIIFSEYHPIFIGYAGNDNSLMDFLLENSGRFESGEWFFPYWMIYKTETVQGKVLEFLEQSQGYLIRHGGFDEVLYRLGAAFDYRLLGEEEFLKDAKKRYENLSNAIDGFTEKAALGEEPGHREEMEKQPENTAEDTAELEKAVQQITDQAEQQRLFREATELYRANKYEEALEKGQKLIEMAPRNARYHNLIGLVWLGMKDYEKALEKFQEAVKLKPNTAIFYSNLGDALDYMGRYEEALGEKKKAVELEPEDAFYHSRFGDIFDRMERYEEALEEKKKAVELEVEDAYYHNSFADTLEYMGKYGEAVRERKKAVELEPEDAYYHYSLGYTLENVERYEEAENAYRTAIELDPEDADYHNALADVLEELGRHQEAEEEYQKAEELRKIAQSSG